MRGDGMQDGERGVVSISLCGLELREVDKVAPSTGPSRSLVSGQNVPFLEDNTDILALASHPLFFVESNIAGCCREDGVVAPHSDLERMFVVNAIVPDLWTQRPTC